MVHEPRTLSAGKTHWNVFSAACEFFKSVRSRGHRSICIQHRVLHQRAAALYQEGVGPDIGDDRLQLQLSDRFVSTGCPLHDAGNGLRWSLAPQSSKELLSDLFIVLSSLRNSFSLLCQKLPLFIMHLKWVTRRHDDQEVRRFWQKVGIDADFIETIAEADPHWDGHNLCVSSVIQSMPGAIGHVHNIFLRVLKIRKFTATRWLSEGTFCRTLTAGFLTD